VHTSSDERNKATVCCENLMTISASKRSDGGGGGTTPRNKRKLSPSSGAAWRFCLFVSVMQLKSERLGKTRLIERSINFTIQPALVGSFGTLTGLALIIDKARVKSPLASVLSSFAVN
jgi:hypothetical protein